MVNARCPAHNDSIARFGGLLLCVDIACSCARVQLYTLGSGLRMYSGVSGLSSQGPVSYT